MFAARLAATPPPSVAPSCSQVRELSEVTVRLTSGAEAHQVQIEAHNFAINEMREAKEAHEREMKELTEQRRTSAR